MRDGYLHFPFHKPDLPQQLLQGDWIVQRAHNTLREAHQRLVGEAEIERLTGFAEVPDPVALELFVR